MHSITDYNDFYSILSRPVLTLCNIGFALFHRTNRCLGTGARVNQSGACSSSDVIMIGGRKSETTMEDKVIVVVCGYPELYIHLRTFTKTGIHFARRLELPGRSPSHDANSCLLCSEFHARMARISRVNEASKLKMFKHPTSRHSRLV